MRIAAIIAEYNPFHNGHAYHIRETKRLTGCDYLIVVMSGDYTQRGVPAFMPKQERASIALSQGADLVLELPLPYATGTAERFATGALSLLDSLGCVTDLCFGCECDDPQKLSDIAALLCCPTPAYLVHLENGLKAGYSFPRARALALESAGIMDTGILDTPNNILAVDYLKALQKLHSSIEPLPIKRIGAGYHETAAHPEGFSSASGIRSLFQSPCSDNKGHFMQASTEQLWKNLSAQVPESACNAMQETFLKTWPVFHEDYVLLYQYSILSHLGETQPVVQDLSPDLWNRIKKQWESFTDIASFIGSLNSKDMTYTRISRALLHLLLQTPDDFPDTCPYARVLGFRKDSTDLLNLIKRKTSLPLVTKLADTSSFLSEEALRMLDHEIQSTRIYHSILQQKYGTRLPDEYRTPLSIF